ncbi:PREDICTED: histone-lysine N-methyltransferase, H3 lysine-9 specific SUVH4-like isoform X1 [Lupinus angustifolius]|uniref:histone-lysine N-methyltransferase, H3 lysine-9 specific SUVH4-like isoform X1 n=1 Tax=Lupinus angustifolius TaxID=3871 RepID=UPI00092E397F|nr:PREDICTED: histone-lysine N-methyltransferase, H3 lysine-9 specific SUVH4-like isoform X1 [Lupinus angustifolius]
MAVTENCEKNVGTSNGLEVLDGQASEISSTGATMSNNAVSQHPEEIGETKKCLVQQEVSLELQGEGKAKFGSDEKRMMSNCSNDEKSVQKKAKVNHSDSGVACVDGEDDLLSNYTHAFPHEMDKRTIFRLKEMLRLVNLKRLQSVEEEKNRCKNEEDNNNLGAGEFSRKRLRSTTRRQVPKAPDYPWYAVNKRSCNFFRLVCKDISHGEEEYSIPVINECDFPPVVPASFTYIKSMQVSDNVKVPVRADGCRCKESCTEARSCSCVHLNGSAPYVPQDGGRLVAPRDVVFECGPKCRCGPDCGNRVSQCGIKYKLQVFRMPDKGWAVRTLEKIPEGAPVCEYIGILKRSDEVENDIDNSYFFEIDCKQTINEIEGRERRLCHVPLPTSSSVDNETTETEPEFCIDAGSYGNVARFINHSCEPNLFVQCVLSGHHDIRLARVVLFAAADIGPYQELTYDYGYQLDSVIGADGNIIQMSCHCGEPNCRKRLY